MRGACPPLVGALRVSFSDIIIMLASSAARHEIYLLCVQNFVAPLLSFPFPSPPSHPSPFCSPPPTSAMNAQSRSRRAGCHRGPRPARPSPDSLLPNTPKAIMGSCAMGRKGERGKGPASYRGLGLRPAVAGLPSHLPWPPKAAAGSRLASGPLAPAFSGPYYISWCSARADSGRDAGPPVLGTARYPCPRIGMSREQIPAMPVDEQIERSSLHGPERG